MKFIHIADVHLGAVPDLGFSWSQDRKKEIWESFARVIEKVKEENVELLLIAGDLFHGQPLFRECRELNFLLEQIPDTAVVLIAGNHDHIKKDSAYLKFPWAKNVIGLWGEQCQSCYIKSCNTYVYGLSYHTREIEEPVYNQLFPVGSVNLRKEEPGAHHILLAHGGDDKHIPIDFTALSKTDFDYIALGHIHKPQIFSEKMAYAGALEPTSRNHPGARGFVRGEVSDGKTRIEFVPFSLREYHEIMIMVSMKSSNGALQKKIREEICARGRQHIYRILFQGRRDPDFEIDKTFFADLGNIVDVLDETEPEYDFERLKQQYAGTVVAAYIESFGENLFSLNEIEKLALYQGVRVLLDV